MEKPQPASKIQSFNEAFASRTVYNEGPFVPADDKHALEVGWEGEETSHFLNKLAQEVASDGKIALIQAPAWSLVLFSSSSDAH